ncbi:glutathione S-transferase [Methylobrevis albus]|uniref:Glutathione S-transferase n=1 Tax=Methylobrevis albus TaxID=2793297 RepID=A0A931MYQ3_9HYPH|nr:glutathione S-transferase [Methylobrevis albus]MBH0238225.1 glutathione S-transferase [Methylobrevis albus]
MATLRIDDCINDVCPLTGRLVAPDALTLYRGSVVGFATPARRDAFLAAILMFESARIVPVPARSCPADRTPGRVAA